MKELLEKVDVEKNQQMTKKHTKLPSRQRVKVSKYLELMFCVFNSIPQVTISSHQKVLFIWNNHDTCFLIFENCSKKMLEVNLNRLHAISYQSY